MNGKELLRAVGISQSMLANQLGVTRQSVNLWIKGERAPNARNITKIAEALTKLGATVTPSEVYKAMMESILNIDIARISKTSKPFYIIPSR